MCIFCSKHSAGLFSTLFVVPLLLGAGDLPAAEPRVLIGNAPDRPAVWRYTTRRPADEWIKPKFDDSQWAEGKAGFGVADVVTPKANIGTPWTTSDIWLRKQIDLAGPVDFQMAGLYVRHDEDVQVYANAKRIFAVTGYNVRTTAYDVTKELKAALKPGRNVVAVHVHQTSGGQYIDLGLVLDPKRTDRWSQAKARQWYKSVGAIRGCNYLPRTATNTTEMWQKETFDPKTIDQELGWAKSVGFNSLRVFVQYLVWEKDPDGLKKRMDQLMRIADAHGIRTMWVLMDDCAFGYPAKHEPYPGKQGDPKPGEYAPFWTPSPGRRRVADRKAWAKLGQYVRDLVGTFKDDQRVLAWDLYNEAKPANRPLIEAAFAWARRASPSQPLTACWHAHDLADVISFHCYGSPAAMKKTIQTHASHGRPVLCTEWLLRRNGNTVAGILPILTEHRVGWFIWGLVAGRTQTFMHWGSKRGDPIPKNWQHDIFHADGKPYRPEEIRLFRKFAPKLRAPAGRSGVGHRGELK